MESVECGWIDSCRTLGAVVLTGLLACVGVSEAAAQSGSGASGGSSTASPGAETVGGVPGKMRVSVFGTLGFGGETDIEVDYDNDDFEDFDVDDVNMETTNGVGAQFDYALHEYFLLGGRLAFNFAKFDEGRENEEDDLDRFMLMNLDVVPKGRLPLAGAPIEFYAAVPLGLSFNFPDDSFEENLIRTGDTNMGAGVSGNVSIHLGLHYWFNSRVGLMVEQGFYQQQYVFPGETEVDRGPLENPRSDFVSKGNFNQYSVNVGLSIGL